jgi:large subunit ribosomal protein L18
LGKGASYRVPYRRRRENKTDYASRRILATSEYPRLVVRVSNTSIIAQIIKSEIEGDYILTQTSSHELKKNYGWIASGKNIPAAYLIGYIIGKKAFDEGIEIVNLDMGLKRVTTGNKVFALVQGANDAGLEIPVDSDVIPSQEAINGQVIAD